MDTKLRTKKGVSPVIAALILSAAVLAVGGIVWSYCQGATIIIAEDYISGINDLVDDISERFIIEQVIHTGTQVRVWLYNYGEIKIVVDVYADVDGGASGSILEVEVVPQGFVGVDIELVVSSGDEVAVKAVSRRGNSAHFRYIA